MHHHGQVKIVGGPAVMIRVRVGLVWVVVVTLILAGLAQGLDRGSLVHSASGSPLQPVLYDIAVRYLPSTGQLQVACTLIIEAAADSAPCRLALPDHLTALFEAEIGDRLWDEGAARAGRHSLSLEAWEEGHRETFAFSYQIGIGDPTWQRRHPDPDYEAAAWGSPEAAWAKRVDAWLPALDSEFDPAGVEYRMSLTVPNGWSASFPDCPADPSVVEAVDSYTFILSPFTPANQNWRWLTYSPSWDGTPWVVSSARSMPPSSERPISAPPVAYEVTAHYHPEDCRLRAECRIEFEAGAGADSLAVSLPAGFAPLDSTLPAEPTGERSGRSIYLLPGQWSEGERRTYSFVYEGTPATHNAVQNGYWDLGTAQALWLTNPSAWLPTTPSLGDDELAALPMTIELRVPDGWRTFTLGSSARLVAGPYDLDGAGETAGVAYEVWGLPDWTDNTQAVVDAMPGLLGYLSDTLGELPPVHVRLPQVPPEQGGGLTARYDSSSPEVTVLFTAGARATQRVGAVTPLVVAHEMTHAVAGFFLDEGLTDYVASRYLAVLGSGLEAESRRAQLDYFLRIADIYGDKSVIEASAGHYGAGETHWNGTPTATSSPIWSGACSDGSSATRPYWK